MISEATLRAWEDTASDRWSGWPEGKDARLQKRDAFILDLIKELRELSELRGEHKLALNIVEKLTQRVETLRAENRGLGKALVSEGCVPPAGWGQARINNFTFDETEDA